MYRKKNKTLQSLFLPLDVKNVKATSSSIHNSVTASRPGLRKLKINKQKTIQLDKLYEFIVDINQILDNQSTGQ